MQLAPTYTADHEQFRTTVRRFIEKEIAPHHAQWEKDGIVSRDLWRKAGAAGLLLTDIPAEYGGGGADFLTINVMAEEMARGVYSGPGFRVHSDIVSRYILHYGSEEQKQKWLPRMASGDVVGAIAMTEPGTGSDLQGVKTTARKSGNGYVLNGAKTFITNGQHANLIVVVAKTDQTQGAKGVSLMVLETEGASGFRRGRKLKKLGLDAADTSELFFDDVPLPADSLLGTQEGQGFYQLMQELSQERLLVATHAQAMTERGLALTIDYVKERKAFGKPILDFQNTQFVLAECKTEATVSRVFVDNCIERHIKGELDAVGASMAKYWVTDMQAKVVDRCLQLFGGYGFMDEYPISRLYRDARVMRIYAGTNEIMKLLIARSL